MSEDLFEIEAMPAPDASERGPESTRRNIVLRVHLQPGAGRAQVAGRHGDALHLRVAVPPERGRANEACVSLLADTLRVAKSHIELLRGDKSREKAFRVTDVDPDAIRRVLDDALARAGGASRPGRGRGARPGR